MFSEPNATVQEPYISFQEVEFSVNEQDGKCKCSGAGCKGLGQNVNVRNRNVKKCKDM